MSRRRGGLGLALLGSLLVHGGLLWGLSGRSAPKEGTSMAPGVVRVEVLWPRGPSRPFDGLSGDRSHRSSSTVGEASAAPRAKRDPASAKTTAPETASAKGTAETSTAAQTSAAKSAAAKPDRTHGHSPSGLEREVLPVPSAELALAGASAASPVPPSRVTVEPPGAGETAPVLAGAPQAGSAVGGGLASQGAPGQAADGPPQASPDPALLEALHQRLAAAAKACYPRAARAFRLRGAAPLRFCLDGKGSAGPVSLLGTTGSPLLDRAAKDCVVPGALPLPGTGCYTVTVEFTDL